MCIIGTSGRRLKTTIRCSSRRSITRAHHVAIMHPWTDAARNTDLAPALARCYLRDVREVWSCGPADVALAPANPD